MDIEFKPGDIVRSKISSNDFKIIKCMVDPRPLYGTSIFYEAQYVVDDVMFRSALSILIKQENFFLIRRIKLDLI